MNGATVSINLPLADLAAALRRLPANEKIAVWRLLDTEIDRAAIAQRFSEALQAIRAAHSGADEDSVMAEVLQATREARAARRGT